MTRQIVREYTPVSDTIKAFHLSDAYSRALIGPFGSGKSWAAVMELWINSLLSRDSLYVCVRKTYPMLRDSVVRTFFKVIPIETGTWYQSEMRFVMEAGGRRTEFLFRSADSHEDIEKFRGVEATGYWLDEAQELNQDIKLILDGRLRYPTNHPRYISLLTSNPCDTSHWLYDLYMVKKTEGHALFRQGAHENPFIEEQTKRNIDIAFKDRPEMYNRYVLGEWGAIFAGKPVYIQEFNFAFHVSKTHLEPIMGLPIHRGWDFGLTPACLFTQVTLEGTWNILRELYSDDMGIDEFGDAVSDYSNQHFRGYTFEDVGDPAGRSRSQTDEKSCMDILAGKNIYCREAPTNEFIPRREAVARKLTRSYKGRPHLLIDPRCKRLIDGFSGGYRYSERGNTGTFGERPDKNQYSHVHDALQYCALDLFGYHDFDPREWKQPLKIEGVIGA